MKKIIVSVFIGLLLFAIAGCSDNEDEELEMSEIVIASGPTGGGWYNTASGVAKLLMKEIPGLNVTVNEGGGYENIKLVNEGDAQIGYAFTNDVLTGYEGKGSFEDDRKMEHVDQFLTLYPSYLQTVTLSGNGIESYKDLGDKNILPGEQSFATVNHVETMLNQYDIS